MNLSLSVGGITTVIARADFVIVGVAIAIVVVAAIVVTAIVVTAIAMVRQICR